MAIIVQKFGGTSVANINRIKNVANIIKCEIDKGNKVVAIVSAMAGTTDQLIKLFEEISCSNDKHYKEYDQIISSGEQISSSLLTIALNNIDIESKSYLGWQLPILTDETHTKALIKSICIKKIVKDLFTNKTVVIAGFQGVNAKGEITTLGRGGSDTTAIAISIALNALRCDIYTDVSGIYTADPNLVRSAQKIETISYDQMLEMASSGAKVLQTRSVIMAARYNVNLNILSSFNNNAGTNIISDSNLMEKSLIKTIVHHMNQVLFTIENNDVISILNLIVKSDIIIDMINKNTINNKDYLSFTAHEDCLKNITLLCDHNKFDLKYKSDLVKITLTGIGLSNFGDDIIKIIQVARNSFTDIYSISNSETKISIIINQNKKDIIVNKLHELYYLDSIN